MNLLSLKEKKNDPEFQILIEVLYFKLKGKIKESIE